MHPPTAATFDRDHVWHPYAAMPGTGLLPVVESASGVRLRLAEPVDGVDELIDGMSSWWAAVHGYGHPVLDRAVIDQVGRMSHVMFGGLTHEPAVRLARTLVDITPEPLQHVFFSDSGSVAVEVATKMCLQYQRGIGRPDRRRLLTWRGGYYGDTLRPMMLCDPEGMHHLWSGDQAGPVFADAPPRGFDAPVDDRYVDHLTQLFEAHADELAAVIVEPVAQGAGGMVFHNPAYLRVLRELCDRHGALLIFDEIATGFGRTGALFAAEHAGVAPDVMCVGKALTGGYLSMAATLSVPAVAAGIARGDVPVLAHGPTFMANPLAASVANAAVGLLLEGDWRAEVARIESGLRSGLAGVGDLPGVADVRVLGAIGVIQLDHPVDVPAATRAAIRNGVWLRPFRDLVYTMPPYVTSDADLERVTAAMADAAQES